MHIVGWIFSALFGIFLGGIIAIYFIIKSIRKKISLSLDKNRPFEVFDGHVKEVGLIIESKKQEYKKAEKGNVFRAVAGLKKKNPRKTHKIYTEIITEVAKVFNSDSKNPFLEFSVREAFGFVRTATERIEDILNAVNLSLLKNCDLSAVFGMAKLVGTVKDNKVVKGVTSFSGKVTRVIKLLNPFFWLKKIIQTVFVTLITTELIFASAEIVGWTFAEFYFECNAEKIKEMQSPKTPIAIDN